VAEHLSMVAPQLIHTQRERLRLQLAAALHADWQWAYDSQQVDEGYQPTREQAGRRDLANLALEMLCRHAVAQADAVWPGRAYQRVKSAGNMSERIGALNALVQSRSSLADAALAHFHALAQRDPLVLDKWFKLQAGANEACDSGPDGTASNGDAGGGSAGGAVLARVRQLLKHADFSLRSPNRARALLVSLCRNNPAAFHRRDASGYVFWAERVIELDAINPSVAARLARAMDRVDQLVEPYRGAAREAIARVAARSDLSDEVREVVSRALHA
jgi:aminopeptidase N